MYPASRRMSSAISRLDFSRARANWSSAGLWVDRPSSRAMDSWAVLLPESAFSLFKTAASLGC